MKESLPKEKRRPIDYSRMIPFTWIKHLGKYKAVLGFIFAFALVQLAGQVMPTTWSFFTMERYGWNKLEVGISLMVVGLLVSIVQAVLTGVVVKKYGNRKVIIAGFVLWTFGMLAIVFADTTFWLYIATLPYLLGGIAGPTVQGMVSNQVSEKEQGNLQGVLTSLASLSAIIAPVIFTTLFAEFTNKENAYYIPGAPFAAGALILVAATFVVIRALKYLNPEEDQTVVDQPLEEFEIE